MWAATVVKVATVGALLLAACGPGGGSARRARLQLQRQHLEASLDRLEARLLDGQARVRGWEELKARHGRVSAVACEVNGRHADDMARLQEEARWLAAGARAPRFASVVAPAASAASAGAAAPLGEVPGAGGD